MARPLYSKALLTGVIAGPGSLNAVVPDGFIWVLRDVTGTLTAGGVFKADVRISAGLETIIESFIPAGTTRSFRDELRVVMGPGEQLAATVVSSTATLNFRLSGYQLFEP